MIENKNEYLQRFQQQRDHGKVVSERASCIKLFHDKRAIKLPDRKTRELRLATAKELAVLLGHTPTEDLEPFYKECQRARSFSRYFWWAMKNKTGKGSGQPPKAVH